MDKTLGSRIKFIKLCTVLEEIFKQSGSKKLGVLKEFLMQCQNEGRKLKEENPNADASMFPILRLILPQLDRERSPYNLKKTLLANLYIRVFCLGKTSKETEMLKRYKIPISERCAKNDFAERVYWISKKRLSSTKTILTIDDINLFLDNLAKKNEMKESKDDIFKLLFQQISALELKWITRLILKDMKLGLGTRKILQAYHPLAPQCEINSSLKQVCDDLYDPKVRMKSDIQVFSFFKPMLLERCPLENVQRLFRTNDKYFVQTKYDGERCQVHMKNGTFKYGTRRKYDITNNWGFGENDSNDGFLTTKFINLLNPNCNSIILDGELMGWHKQKRTFGSKSMSYDVKKLSSNSSYQPCFVAFDILMYNDEILTNSPYEERLKILTDAFQDEEGSLIKCRSRVISNSEDVLEVFNKCLHAGDEGIVLKKSDCTYKPNIREGSDCYKIKTEYSSDLVEDLDLIILGGYYGENGCSITSFLMGVTQVSRINEGKPKQFLSFASVSSGIKGEERIDLLAKLSKYWIKDCPEYVSPPKDKPDVWIRPENSLILTLRASELTQTSEYPSGYTLVFPRVIRIREDKPWDNACTLREVLSYVKHTGAVHKLTKRQAILDDIQKPEIKKKKVYKFTTSKYDEGLVRSKVVRRSNLEPLDNLLEGKEICVINGMDEFTKEHMEHVLLLHSAKIVQNPRKQTFCVIVGNPKEVKAKNIIRSQRYDVVTADWFKHITKEESWSSLENFVPWEMLCSRNSTKQVLDKRYDCYYDSFTTNADEDSLKRSFQKAEEEANDLELTLTIEQSIDKELFEDGVSPFSLFRGIVAYFMDSTDCAKFIFRFMAGTLKEDMDENVTHIFTNTDSSVSMKLHKDVCKTKKRKSQSAKIVKSKWIEDCFRDKKVYSIDEYIIKEENACKMRGARAAAVTLLLQRLPFREILQQIKMKGFKKKKKGLKARK